ncbi:MAG TPA: hypothetical protein VLF91_03455 [Candidatus Saccharimonadales bacterium]|nr:hypothetical protein [Candidatus Saccharimonadales bacterium]
MWFRSKNPVSLQQQLAKQERAEARQKAKLERAKQRCRQQLHWLRVDLHVWASLNQMWFDDIYGHSHGQHYALRDITRITRKGAYTYTIHYFADGTVTVLRRILGSTAGGDWMQDYQPELWRWLRTVTPQEMIDSANRSGYIRGAGKHSFSGSLR